MKKIFIFITVLAITLTLCGCIDSNKQNNETESNISKLENISFKDDQLYAVAYLGYQEIDDIDYYIENYLDSAKIPIHYISSGDYYLIIPRYEDMNMTLFVNDFDTDMPILHYTEPNCKPFIVQCNVSDIFADVTIKLEYNDDIIEFTPFISLKNGDVLIGERGLDLTKVE